MKKIYFASDFHLGTPNIEKSHERERKIVRWLDSIAADAEKIFLVGDVFDFWFEYKTVIPKGYVRLLGKLAELRDKGIEIHYFVGNHDLWMFEYMEKELDIPIHRTPLQFEWQGKQFFVAHGDGLGPKDKGYKRLKKVFTNRFCQWLFRWLHPDLGMRLARFMSKKSRDAQDQEDHFHGENDEWLLVYANYKIQQLPNTDFFIFGHRHLPLDILLKNKKSRYINTGEWLSFFSFAVFDGFQLEVQFFEQDHKLPLKTCEVQGTSLIPINY